MARLVQFVRTSPVAGIAEPHQSTVATILRAAQRGLFTAAEAGLMIDRVRAGLATLPLSIKDSRPCGGNTHTLETRSDSPNRTVA